MTLAELIARLEAANPAQVVKHGFNNPHSYRGDYMDLAFEPAADITVADMLSDARSALGTTYQGWKGGDFTMGEHTWCWLSTEGDASGETIGALLLDLMLAVPAGVAPATDQTALRERIRRVLCERDGQAALWGTDMLEPDEYGADADAVLSVLPASVDRADVIAATVRTCAEHLRSNWTDTWTADAARSLDLNAARIERGEDTALLRRVAAETRTDNQTQEQPVHVGGNAEDYPACNAQGIDTLSYPWECPGPEQPAGGAQQPKETRP
jgi:hypothetical protein